MKCPTCGGEMEWTITEDARIWNCLEPSCDDVNAIVEGGHFCPKCGGPMRDIGRYLSEWQCPVCVHKKVSK